MVRASVLKTMGRAFLAISVVIPIGAIGVLYQLLSIPHETPVVHKPATWVLVTTPPVPPSAAVRPGRPSMRGLGWQVVDYLSAHRVLVVNVQTYRMDEAMDIAVELIGPLQEGYSEVLVYFHHPHEALAARRVQWSLASGFVEIDFSDFSNLGPVVPEDRTSDAGARSPLSKGP